MPIFRQKRQQMEAHNEGPGGGCLGEIVNFSPSSEELHPLGSPRMINQALKMQKFSEKVQNFLNW